MKFKIVNENFRKDYGANLLRSRGIDDINLFLNPTKDCLQSYRDFKNISAGLRLFDSVIDKVNPRFALIVDPDMDGFTSSAILYNYLKAIWNVDIDYYLHSGKQHGLQDTWERILNSNTHYDLLLIPDASSNDGFYIDTILDKGIKVLVIDHHLVEEKEYNREGCVIINNQLSPLYKNKDLSGAGMAYQFCRALDDFYGFSKADDFLDLAAAGICGDMMSALSYENQYIWKAGFSNIKNYFLNVLCEKQSFSMNNKINPTTVAFYIVPMINAMVRVGTDAEKERLFLAFIDGERMIPSQKRGAKGTFEKVAVESARECTNAKTHQDKIKKEASEALELKIQKYDLLSNMVLFVRLEDDDNFPSELNGLIATQLSKKYNRPTIVARLNDEGFIRGSARGLNESELKSFKDFLSESGYFEYTMGHEQAFGISIPNSNLSEFHAYANKALKDYNFGETSYDVNFVRSASEKDISNICYDLKEYEEIWGQKSPEPLIAITDLFVRHEDIKIMGKNKDTLKIEKNGITYIKFFAKDLFSELQYPEMKINLVGKCNVNEWMGCKSPQIIIEDLEAEDANLAF